MRLFTRLKDYALLLERLSLLHVVQVVRRFRSENALSPNLLVHHVFNTLIVAERFTSGRTKSVLSHDSLCCHDSIRDENRSQTQDEEDTSGKEASFYPRLH